MKNHLIQTYLSAASLALSVFGAQAGMALTTLHTFYRLPNGGTPTAGLVCGSDGSFYGITFYGGSNDAGTVFRICTNGMMTSLYSFTGGNDGANPAGRLTQGSDGSFYGTTVFGGTNNSGTVFKINTNGALTSLYSFTGGSDGEYPETGLVQATDGSFYGTTGRQGDGYGTVFKISTNGTLTSLHSFTPWIDGEYPGKLLQGADGYFYGTVSYGGSGNTGYGSVFKISPVGALTILHVFGADNGQPSGGLVQGTDGYLYGTTLGGASFTDWGAVFKISTNGTLMFLYSFSGGDDGRYPQAELLQGGDGYFYGTTYGGPRGYGTVFKISSSGALTTLYSFSGGDDGVGPVGGLVQGGDGNIYGVTYEGGRSGFSFTGTGTVYQLSTNGALTSVTIPDNVTSIGAYAFAGSSLTSVAFSTNITNIGAFAFAASGLTNVTIPDSVTSIGVRAFAYCGSLAAITVAPQNSSYSSLNGILFNKTQTTLVECPRLFGSYVIPGSVTTIGDYAFVSSGLANVTIPNTVTTIGDGAFFDCESLNSLVIPDSAVSIGDHAFQDNSSLTDITIPDSITSLGASAFADCGSLTSVTIGNGVTNIGDSAFQSCSNVTSVTIGKGVTNLGDSAFRSCSSLTNVNIGMGVIRIGNLAFAESGLTSVTIPDSVTSLGDSAFADCYSLTNVTIGNGITSLGDSAFGSCSSLTNANIGHGVTRIGNLAFAGSGLTSVTIPDSVTNIGDYAFDECHGLTSVTIPTSVTSIGGWAFEDCTGLTVVYFQCNAPAPDDDTSVFFLTSATIYYLPGTLGWTNIFDGRPTALWFLAQPVILSQGPGFGVQSNHFGFTISWATNASIVVEACTNLPNPAWLPVSTNTLVSGTSYFSDPQPANLPSRFYRLKQQ